MATRVVDDFDDCRGCGAPHVGGARCAWCGRHHGALTDAIAAGTITAAKIASDAITAATPVDTGRLGSLWRDDYEWYRLLARRTGVPM